jgi:Domain of unknown function DUF29
MTEATTLYDEDFFVWSKQQADALRAAARNGSNQKLDWENLAEEIENLGRSERRELARRLSTIIEHLVKLDHSPAKGPRHGWRQTIRRERLELCRLLEDSPSLRREAPDMAKKETAAAAETALADLEDRGEVSPGLREQLTAKSYLDLFSYSADQILGDWFPADTKS